MGMSTMLVNWPEMCKHYFVRSALGCFIYLVTTGPMALEMQDIVILWES